MYAPPPACAAAALAAPNTPSAPTTAATARPPSRATRGLYHPLRAARPRAACIGTGPLEQSAAGPGAALNPVLYRG
jgi:hypothetical protein